MPCEEDVSSSHVDTEKPNMSINQSLTYSVARDTAKLQKPDAEESKSMLADEEHPLLSQESVNLPKQSQKVKQVPASSLFVNHQKHVDTQSHHNSFIAQNLNVSIGSMSDSLNARFIHANKHAGLRQPQTLSQHKRTPATTSGPSSLHQTHATKKKHLPK